MKDLFYSMFDGDQITEEVQDKVRRLCIDDVYSVTERVYVAKNYDITTSLKFKKLKSKKCKTKSCPICQEKSDNANDNFCELMAGDGKLSPVPRDSIIKNTVEKGLNCHFASTRVMVAPKNIKFRLGSSMHGELLECIKKDGINENSSMDDIIHAAHFYFRYSGFELIKY